MSLHSSCVHGFRREIWCHSYLCFLYKQCIFFSFGFLQDFSLSVIFCSLKMICIVCEVFILLGVLWASWICGLASGINLRLSNCFRYFLRAFLCFSFWYPQLCTLQLLHSSHSPWIFCSVFSYCCFLSLFSLLLSFQGFYWYIF